MTPAQIAHIMKLVVRWASTGRESDQIALEAALRDAPQAEGWVMVPAEIVDRFPEISTSNYDHDDACALNGWGVELVLAARPSAPTPPPEAKTEAERNAFSFGWFKAFEHMRNQKADPLEKLTRISEELGLYDDMGAPTAVEPDAPLKWCSYCGEGVTTFCRGKQSPDWDYKCPLLNLPAPASKGTPL